MSRCDYEGVFYRVFCIGLLVIAFTFTVILTNVFIDIDGLLSRKEQESAKQDNAEHTTQSRYDQKADIPDYYGGDKNYDESDGAYRTKRSLGSSDFLLHVKAPKSRHLLRNQLVTLLSELDNNEPARTIKENNEFKEDLDDIYVAEIAQKAKVVKKNKEDKTETSIKRIHDEKITGDVLHLAIHNVLLQGIAKHMDLNDVVAKVKSIVKSFKNEEKNKQDNNKQAEQTTEISFEPSEAVVKILNELSHCKKLENDVTEQTKAIKKQEIKKSITKHPKLFINTYIDIGKASKTLNKNLKENITGVIKLIYNGQAIKLKNMEEIATTTKSNTFKDTTANYLTSNVEQIAELIQEDYKSKQIPKLYVTTMLQDILKKLTSKDNTNDTEATNKETRPKRHVKLRKKSKKHDDDDDEVFVEIETHFDAKERKGKKKKALIKQLIEKIRNALRSNGKEKKHKHGHVKKRVQLNLSNHIFDDKYLIPYDISLYTHRELHPISKVAALKEELLPNVADQNGNEWRRKDIGPKFFSTSKSINSAEIRQVEVGYSKVMQLNDVPQRLQIPLNSDLSEENLNTYLDLGSLQYLIKDLEGTGFSVGLNQYVDQEPDAESIKLFTGLEKLIKTYHQYYDQGNDQNYDQHNEPNNDQNYDQNYTGPDDKSSGIVYQHEMKKRDIEINRYGERFIKKRSVRDNRSVHSKSTGKLKDYHTNEYQIIFDNKFEPYDNYQEIFEDKRKRTLLSLNNNSDEDKDEKGSEGKGLPKDFNKLMEKKLKPSEIFSLADLLDRKRRSYNVQKITNLKTKIRLNRYINTNAMPKPQMMINNNRNKRQVEKVRIFAKDQNSRSDSDENVYIFSNENVYADRALMRRANLPNYLADENKAEERVDETFGDSKPGVYSVYEEINPLMSKYPHIFVDDFTISKFTEDTPTVFGRVSSKPVKAKVKDIRSKTLIETEGGRKSVEEQMPKVHDLVRALEPHTKTNYKFTIKLIPQEKMGNRTKEGFKEVHTSINKTYDKNGIHYSSLVNVSEISKIEHKNPEIYEDYEPDKNGIQMESTTEIYLETQPEPVTTATKEYKEQSANLNKESENIKQDKNPIVFKDGRRSNSDMVDILLPFNPPRTVRFSKDVLGQILISTLQEDSPKTTTTRITTRKQEFVPVEINIKELVTTKKPENVPLEMKTKELDPIKFKLLKAISQNERLTSMVLSKIDRNTGLLEAFLNKITEKMQALPDMSQRVVNKIESKLPDRPVPLQVYKIEPKIPDHPVLPQVYKIEPKISDHIVPPQVYNHIHPGNINVGSRLPFAYSYNNHPNKTENPGIVYHKYVYPGSNKKTIALERNPLNEHSKYFVDEDDYIKRFITVPEFKPNAKHDEVAVAVKDPLRPQAESFIVGDTNKKNQKEQELKANSNAIAFTNNPTNRNISAVQILNYGHNLVHSPTATP